MAIFGDYDVDGFTSAARLAWHLRHCGLDPLIHILARIVEGYGPNVEAVRMLAGKGATLLVTVDCGTTSLEPLAEARRLGMAVVVIDHHQSGDELPEVEALVNPNRPDDLSGLGHLAAVGLVLVTLGAKARYPLSSHPVQVFGRRHDDPSTRCGGRRPKSAKARSRGKFGTGGAAGAMGI